MGFTVRVTPAVNSVAMTHHFDGFEGGNVGASPALPLVQVLESLAADVRARMAILSPAPSTIPEAYDAFRNALVEVASTRSTMRFVTTSICGREDCLVIENVPQDRRDYLICICPDGRVVVESIGTENDWEDVPAGFSVAVLDTRKIDVLESRLFATADEAGRREVLEKLADAFLSVHPDLGAHTCEYKIELGGVSPANVRGLCVVWAPTRSRIWNTEFDFN